MRKIERQMIQAIVDERSHWSKDNTRVETEYAISSVYIHGHKIVDALHHVQRWYCPCSNACVHLQLLVAFDVRSYACPCP